MGVAKLILPDMRGNDDFFHSGADFVSELPLFVLIVIIGVVWPNLLILPSVLLIGSVTMVAATFKKYL